MARDASYVELLSAIDEVNRPPGGKDSIRLLVQNCFLRPESMVLDVGCNTGYCTFEIAHLAHCQVTGVDISPAMVEAANRTREADPLKALVEFRVADGLHLPFEDKTFDVVMSGGSTAFMQDKPLALREYARVTKLWGFVCDINFFYHTPPPTQLLNRINSLLQINIEPWDQAYWLQTYAQAGLETYHTATNHVYVPTPEEVNAYTRVMTQGLEVDVEETRAVVAQRFGELMRLFAQNHQYLDYGVFVSRKRPIPEQPSLFGA